MKEVFFIFLIALISFKGFPQTMTIHVNANGYAGDYFVNTPPTGQPYNGNKDFSLTQGNNFINFGETKIEFAVNSNGVDAATVSPIAAFIISADKKTITFNVVAITIKVGINYKGYYSPSFDGDGKQFITGQKTYSLVKAVTYQFDNCSHILNSQFFFFVDATGNLVKTNPNHSSAFTISGKNIILNSTSCKLNYSDPIKTGSHRDKVFNVGDSVYLINSLSTQIFSTTGALIDTIYP